jgi:hypothetical protein
MEKRKVTQCDKTEENGIRAEAVRCNKEFKREKVIKIKPATTKNTNIFKHQIVKLNLTLEQRMKVMTYPVYWQSTLHSALEQGVLFEDIVKELEELDKYL